MFRLAPRGKKGIKGQAFIAGSARIKAIPAATMEVLTGFIRGNVKPKTHILTDAWKSYKDLYEYKHIPVVQGSGKNAAENMPIIHIVFSNIKAWLNGTHHGVSVKHLPRYLREWNYRFNRRNMPANLDMFLLNRAANRTTITYRELVGGLKPEGV